MNVLSIFIFNQKINFLVLNNGSYSKKIEYGEPFLPEYVYYALRGLKRFNSMKGRQEDAEEFLCFLLDGLHEEFLTGKLIKYLIIIRLS